MPFVEILTRCYRRPVMLAVNQASLDAQTDDDWVQTLLIDDIGRGVAWANRRLGWYAPQLVGDYIWIMDDDDECICPTFVADIRDIVARRKPDLIMVRCEYDRHGILPPDGLWKKPPQLYRIGMSGFVVRREVWQRHADAFPYDLAGDYSFISAVYAATPSKRVYWHDRVVMRVQRISQGAPE